MQVIFALLGLVLFLVVFSVIMVSVERMDVDISAYYEFGNILPKSGNWAVILYIAILTAIVLFFAVVLKVQLHSLPA